MWLIGFLGQFCPNLKKIEKLSYLISLYFPVKIAERFVKKMSNGTHFFLSSCSKYFFGETIQWSIFISWMSCLNLVTNEISVTNCGFTFSLLFSPQLPAVECPWKIICKPHTYCNCGLRVWYWEGCFCGDGSKDQTPDYKKVPRIKLLQLSLLHTCPSIVHAWCSNTFCKDIAHFAVPSNFMEQPCFCCL